MTCDFIKFSHYVPTHFYINLIFDQPFSVVVIFVHVFDLRCVLDSQARKLFLVTMLIRLVQ